MEIPASPACATPSDEEQRALVHRVVESQPFRRSARLRDFLKYVAQRSLSDPHADLNEQEIGEKVFGRPTSYDRSQDNIVRVNATELRRRIDQYFADEGRDEIWLVEIPRGGYKPVFHRRTLPDLAAMSAPLSEVARPVVAPVLPTFGSLRWPYVTWAVATGLLLAVCILLWRQNQVLVQEAVPRANDKILRGFWDSFARNHQQVDVVLPDDSASVVEDITHQAISLQDYLRSEYMKRVEESHLSVDRKMDLDEIASHDLITFGDMKAAHQVMAEIRSTPPPQLVQARYYTADAMRRNNLIFIGGLKANPWVRLLDDRMNFVVDYDYVLGHGVVINKHPRPGEEPSYVPPSSPNALTGYSVVSYLPNPSQNGKALVLAGMDADSTSAAAEFITSEAQMEHFMQTIRAKQVPYFEVLLRISRVKGTPFNTEIVAYRTYPDLN